jgi:hypothetical protein
VLSLCASKFNHYALAAYPFLAAATAIAARAGLRALGQAHAREAVGRTAVLLCRGLLVLVVCLVAARAIRLRTVFLPGREFNPQARYGDLFQSMRRQGVARVQVVDGGSLLPGQAGVSLGAIPADYAPQLWFYTLLWKDRGVAAERITPAVLARLPAGAVAASCDPGLRLAVLAQGDDMAATPGCVAVRVAK